MEEISRRREHTEILVSRLLGNLPQDKNYTDKSNVCVYATGSTGRREASENSDLDLIMLSRAKLNSDGATTSASEISALDEICIKADFINAVRKSGIPDLDGQGKYFRNFTSSRLISAIGAPGDDDTGAFTARLLLLLESRPLIGVDIHRRGIEDVLAAYWSDFPGHSDHFVPAFFTNDVLRLWRTFAVNYEARTKSLTVEQRFKKRVKNLKLKYNRMITCYSAILYMLSEFSNKGTITTDAAVKMCLMTPIERIASLPENSEDAALQPEVNEILERYNTFLAVASRSEEDLVLYMAEANHFETERKAAYGFGHAIYRVLNRLGKDNDLHRLIVV